MRRTWSFVLAVIRAFVRHRDPQASSAIAYQVLFAIIPLTGLLLAAFGFFMQSPERRVRMIDLVIEVVPLQSNAFVIDAIRAVATQSVGLTIVGLVGFVWSSTALFSAIREAFNATWEVRTPRSFLMGKLVDVGAMVGLGLLLATSLAGTVGVHLLQGLGGSDPTRAVYRVLMPLSTMVGLVFPAAISFLTFLLLYRYVPNVRHCMGDVWMGALVATLLFEFGKHAFTFYVTYLSPVHSAYGALGDVMLFMLWMWLSSLVLLIGAEVSAEHNRMTCGHAVEARPVEPSQTSRHAA